ncbi:RNA-guided endonuclease InsQ/TnpB family protein [Streptomyces sp. AK010]|uniref:RNA-guided endonuclease InsQ/TnpB family protein n=1 Tax=Streptomyces sp. AK010 TaxID=2723074 RepID=UPI0037D9C153
MDARPHLLSRTSAPDSHPCPGGGEWVLTAECRCWPRPATAGSSAGVSSPLARPSDTGRLQQQHARTKKGSNRRKACRERIRVMLRRVRDRRRDFHAQTARHVVDGNGLIVLEDLNAAGMTATARGTSAEPGSHVGQKAGLNRAILDKGWHSFELAVRNRARHTGTAVRTVNPALSSTTCPAGGYVHPDNRESQAKFVCTSYGHREHADTVGAKNVLARGHTGHRAWRPRRQPVCEAPTSAKPQGISAPTAEVGILSASADGRIAKSVMWDVTRVSLHET